MTWFKVLVPFEVYKRGNKIQAYMTRRLASLVASGYLEVISHGPAEHR